MSLLRELNDNLAHIIITHVEPIFKDGTRLTLIARTPGNTEADVLVSNDDLNELAALIERSKARETIGPLGVAQEGGAP